jgi:hypothetical protein
MSNGYKVQSAVLFMVFNRPSPTAKVFEEIRKAKPSRLYIAADGPRVTRINEAEIVESVRAIILSNIDWDCEVKTLFRTQNLGCKVAISSSIEWFFLHEEEGIILEDDCLPSSSFFEFCDEMLRVYRDNKSIGMIAGSNLMGRSEELRSDYYFSKYVLIWGWASWRDRWIGTYDVDMKIWPTAKLSASDWLYGDNSEVVSWSATFEAVFKGQIDTWDYQWVFANWINKRLSVIPRVNLISNIGFGNGATHTTRKTEVANLARNILDFPIGHLEAVSRNVEADHIFYMRHIYCHPVVRCIKLFYHKLKKLLFPFVSKVKKLKKILN